MRDALRNAGILFLSTVVSLGLAELAVRSFVSVRDVGPVFTTHDPVQGKRMKASFTAERITPEFTMRFTTNSLGFRGPEPEGIPRNPILFLGDSFTLGYGVSDGEEYPALVAAQLRRRHGAAAPPVVNAGIGNAGNGFWLKLLRREAATMRPRLVVMQVFENDFADNTNDGLFTLGPDGSLQELPVPGPGATRTLGALVQAIPGLSYSHVVGLLREVRAPRLGPAGEPASVTARQNGTDPGAQLTLRILEEAVSLCGRPAGRTSGRRGAGVCAAQAAGGAHSGEERASRPLLSHRWPLARARSRLRRRPGDGGAAGAAGRRSRAIARAP